MLKVIMQPNNLACISLYYEYIIKLIELICENVYIWTENVNGYITHTNTHTNTHLRTPLNYTMNNNSYSNYIYIFILL